MKEIILTKKQKRELNQLTVQMVEEAISVRLDYEQSGSNLDSGSVIEIHQNSPLLEDENKKLGDVILTIKKNSKK